MNLGLLSLRVGLGCVFLWFGVDKFFSPDVWLNYVPLWLPVGVSFIYVLGAVESLLGLSLLLGLFSRVSAVICALMLVPIMFSLGFNELMVRDLGLFFLAVGIALLGSGKYSLGQKFFKSRLFW